MVGWIAASMSAAGRLWLGLDLGATNAKAAVVDDTGKLIAAQNRRLTGDMSPESVVEHIIACSQACLAGLGLTFADIAGIGLGSPGKINVTTGVVEGIANFPWPPAVPLAKLVSKRAGGRPVRLVNDADAVVAAELWVGIGTRSRHFVVLTLGSGIGCGIVADGRILQGCSGTIEGGHMIVQAEGGRSCGCGSSGCLEAYASANAVARQAREALATPAADAPSTLRDVPIAEDEAGVTAHDVFVAAQAGDALALSIVDRVARVLAVGCINLSRVSPQCCLGAR